MALLGDDDEDVVNAVLRYVEDFEVDGVGTAPTAVTESAAVTEALVAEARVHGRSLASDDDSAVTAQSGKNWMASHASAISVVDSNRQVTNVQTAANAIRARRRAASNSRKKMLRKAGVYKNPNLARDERRLEVAYLRKKTAQLELELHELQNTHQQSRSPSVDREEERSGTENADSNPTLAADQRARQQGSKLWEGVAARQRKRREGTELENVRLKLILKSQIKVAKGLESMLIKRAQQQVAECSSIQARNDVASRTTDFRAEASDFHELLGHLDDVYRNVDAVLAINGLAKVELSQQDVQMREGVNGMFLEVFANKVMPFNRHAVAEATWNYFKGMKKHRGSLYAKEAQNLASPFTIIEHFSKELLAGNASTDVRIKQVVRRYVEAEREIIVWVALVAPLEDTTNAFKPFHGFQSLHRNFALVKRAQVSSPEHELSVLQLVSHVSVKTKNDTIYDPKYIRVLTDVLLSNTVGNIKSDQELIENVLVDQTLQR